MELTQLKIKDVLFVKRAGKKPIYAQNQLFYLGIEKLMIEGEHYERAIKCETIEEAEREALRMVKTIEVKTEEKEEARG